MPWPSSRAANLSRPQPSDVAEPVIRPQVQLSFWPSPAPIGTCDVTGLRDKKQKRVQIRAPPRVLNRLKQLRLSLNRSFNAFRCDRESSLKLCCSPVQLLHRSSPSMIVPRLFVSPARQCLRQACNRPTWAPAYFQVRPRCRYKLQRVRLTDFQLSDST